MAKLNIVGTGPGSPDYVTPAARKTVQQAQIVIGAQRCLKLFETDIKGEAIGLTAKNLDPVINSAITYVQNGKEVTFLSTGDPGFSGLLKTIQKRNLSDKVEIKVVPGVSSIQACAAKLSMSWDQARLFTFHEGKISNEEKKELVSAAKKGSDLILLPDPKAFSPRDIAIYLIKAGLPKTTPVFICENLTLSNETLEASTLQKVAAKTFGSLCVMVIKNNPQEL